MMAIIMIGIEISGLYVNHPNDIVIAVKGNVLSVRRLYKSGKAIILQAMNPKYQTIVVNVFSEDMILGKVETLSREIK